MTNPLEALLHVHTCPECGVTLALSPDAPPQSGDEPLSVRDAYMFEQGVEEGKRLSPYPDAGLREAAYLNLVADWAAIMDYLGLPGDSTAPDVVAALQESYLREASLVGTGVPGSEGAAQPGKDVAAAIGGGDAEPCESPGARHTAGRPTGDRSSAAAVDGGSTFGAAASRFHELSVTDASRLAALPPRDALDVAGLRRNIEDRIERANDGASVGELSKSPVGEAIAWELASLLVDVTEQRGMSTADWYAAQPEETPDA